MRISLRFIPMFFLFVSNIFTMQHPYTQDLQVQRERMIQEVEINLLLNEEVLCIQKRSTEIKNRIEHLSPEVRDDILGLSNFSKRCDFVARNLIPKSINDIDDEILIKALKEVGGIDYFGIIFMGAIVMFAIATYIGTSVFV